MAGRVAACELACAGHDPLVLEVRPRVGGRVYTMREPLAPGPYTEVGAMRIPRARRRTLAHVDMVRIDGGMDQLPRAFLPALASRIRFGARLSAVDRSDDAVTIHYQTAAGRARNTGDHAILAVPFPALRCVEMVKPLSRNKRRASRPRRCDAPPKILFRCRHRFRKEDGGIVGGASVTHAAARSICYLAQCRETGRGILRPSSTWSEDAQRLGSLSPDERIVQALEYVAVIHPHGRDEFDVGAPRMWHEDPYAGGAFAPFEPSRQTLLYEHIVAPEGRIHFAGEHASLRHAWNQGAIESGLRAAGETNAMVR
jgi:monoamine oxidase